MFLWYLEAYRSSRQAVHTSFARRTHLHHLVHRIAHFWVLHHGLVQHVYITNPYSAQLCSHVFMLTSTNTETKGY
jgi:hypothetical protein